jgi:hypothetical protein
LLFILLGDPPMHDIFLIQSSCHREKMLWTDSQTVILNGREDECTDNRQRYQFIGYTYIHVYANISLTQSQMDFQAQKEGF